MNRFALMNLILFLRLKVFWVELDCWRLRWMIRLGIPSYRIEWRGFRDDD